MRHIHHYAPELAPSDSLPDCHVIVKNGEIVGVHDEPCHIEGNWSIRYVPADSGRLRATDDLSEPDPLDLTLAYMAGRADQKDRDEALVRKALEALDSENHDIQLREAIELRVRPK